MPDARIADALTMAGRSLRLSARSPEALLTALLLPAMLMVVFVYLFGGAVDIGTNYVDYVVPGVLLLCAVTGASTTAVTVCQDMTGGIIDRFRSLDVPGTAVLAGHVTASLLRNIVSSVLVTAVAFGLGFRPHASVAGFAAALGVLLLFVAAVSWLAAAFGLLVSAPEAANSAMFFMMFFSYASSAFVPVRTMPWWLRGFARHQPATPVTETRPAAQAARRSAAVDRAGLVRRHPGRLGSGLGVAVPPPHGLSPQDPGRPMLATFASAARIRSAGVSSISSPRRPPLQNTVAKLIADSSSTTGSRLRWPTGEMPPATYPVARSAAATWAIAAFLPPQVPASAFRSSWPSTGTTAATRVPSTSAISVLNTRSDEMPRAWLASRP